MRFRLLCILALLPITAFAQEWGDMWFVDFDSIPPYSVLGFFNPSYCENDSLLYFDAFMRGLPDIGGTIYISKYYMIDDYPIYIWSCPDSLPAPINMPGYINAMPDISPSGDTLFFCSNRPGTRGGSDIWISIRIDSIWSEPANLGDSINTSIDEYAPDYSPVTGILFFDRFDAPNNRSTILSSQKMNDSTWSQATALPEVINIPGHKNYGPSYDENRQALYFSSSAALNIEPIYRSYYSNGEWGTPVALSDSVNGFWYWNYCGRVSTENADIVSNGSKLFYNKHIWEASYCIDFYSYIFYSHVLPDAIDERNDKESLNDFNVYPNPSNGSFMFQINGDCKQYTLNIFNINGQLVKKFEGAPNIPIVWNGLNEAGESVSSGIYFAFVNINHQITSRKITLLK